MPHPAIVHVPPMCLAARRFITQHLRSTLKPMHIPNIDVVPLSVQVHMSINNMQSYVHGRVLACASWGVLIMIGIISI